jgi:hypothetical protein
VPWLGALSLNPETLVGFCLCHFWDLWHLKQSLIFMGLPFLLTLSRGIKTRVAMWMLGLKMTSEFTWHKSMYSISVTDWRCYFFFCSADNTCF